MDTLAALAALVCCSGKDDTKPVVPEEPEIKEYVSDGSWNGDFVIALARRTTFSKRPTSCRSPSTCKA